MILYIRFVGIYDVFCNGKRISCHMKKKMKRKNNISFWVCWCQILIPRTPISFSYFRDAICLYLFASECGISKYNKSFIRCWNFASFSSVYRYKLSQDNTDNMKNRLHRNTAWERAKTFSLNNAFCSKWIMVKNGNLRYQLPLQGRFRLIFS